MVKSDVQGQGIGREMMEFALADLDPDLRADNKGNAQDAAKVGAKIAEKAKAAGIEKVAFDRSGYQYHGRVKALAEAAREGGLQF